MSGTSIVALLYPPRDAVRHSMLRSWLPLAVWAALVLAAPRAGLGETIYVKLLVDEEEPAVQQRWQKRLQRRLQAASEIIHKYCDVQFAVAAYDTWKSDNRINEFSRSLQEFESNVRPQPAQIAIGFTSQFQFKRGRNSLGGTRGPMRAHILIREGARTVFEAERIEVLVHELGHFLGAVHSERADSVMRPILGDGKARSKTFNIQFDRQNARVISMVGDEISRRRVRRFDQLSRDTKQRLRGIYVQLADELPKDGAAKRGIFLVDQSLRRPPQPVRRGRRPLRTAPQ